MKYALVTAALAAPVVIAAPTKRQGANIDTTVLQFALTLEHLENVFYKGALQKFSQEDFKKAGYGANYYNNIKYIASDEESHVKFLEAALTAAGQTPTAACTYNFPYTDVNSFIALSAILEGVGTSAYLGGAPLITSKDYLTAAGSILVTEALHTSLQRSAVNEVPNANAYGTPLDPTSVFTLASAFIKECPASNPTLPFTPFPALTLTTTAGTCEQPDCKPKIFTKRGWADLAAPPEPPVKECSGKPDDHHDGPDHYPGKPDYPEKHDDKPDHYPGKPDDHHDYYPGKPDDHHDGPDYHPGKPDDHHDGPDYYPGKPDDHHDGPDYHPGKPDYYPGKPDDKHDGPDYYPGKPDGKPDYPEKHDDKHDDKPDYYPGKPDDKHDGPDYHPGKPDGKPDYPEKHEVSDYDWENINGDYGKPPSAPKNLPALRIGEKATFTTASAIPAGSFLTFVSGLAVVSVPATIDGTSASVAIPPQAMGQSYVFVTSAAAANNKLDGTTILAGPAILEVAPAPPMIDFSQA